MKIWEPNVGILFFWERKEEWKPECFRAKDGRMGTFEPCILDDTLKQVAMGMRRSSLLNCLCLTIAMGMTAVRKNSLSSSTCVFFLV